MSPQRSFYLPRPVGATCCFRSFAIHSIFYTCRPILTEEELQQVPHRDDEAYDRAGGVKARGRDLDGRTVLSRVHYEQYNHNTRIVTHGVGVRDSPVLARNDPGPVDPYDAADIAHQIERLIGDEELRRDLREKEFALTARYSWKATALATCAGYERACLRGG